jgi:hypothetical protein
MLFIHRLMPWAALLALTVSACGAAEEGTSFGESAGFSSLQRSGSWQAIKDLATTRAAAPRSTLR